MTIFNPESFIDAQTTTAATRRPPLPAGQVYPGLIGDVKSRTWQDKTDPTKGGLIFDVAISFDVPSLNLGDAFKNINQVVLTDAVFVDVTADGTGIDWSPGKNSKLRRYREALGMNKEGVPFSPRQMTGRQIQARISHRDYQGDLYDQIEAIVKA